VQVRNERHTSAGAWCKKAEGLEAFWTGAKATCPNGVSLPGGGGESKHECGRAVECGVLRAGADD